MGAYTCEFGVIHKVCRCPTPHTIKCDVPEEHGKEKTVEESVFSMSLPVKPCPKLALGGIGKHERHDSHTFWGSAVYRKAVSEFRCPGRD
jgi:hypothetical protein